MRADVPTNSCTNQLETNDDLGGSPPHPHDMAAANRTLSCDKKQNFISTHELTQGSHFGPNLLAPSLRRCCSSQVATLSVRRVSPYQVSRIQLKPLITPWSSGVWRSTRLNAH